MKSTLETWAISITTIVILILVIQWSWNQVMPIFGIPGLNLFQAIGLFALVFIGVSVISIAWNYHVKPRENHFYEIQGQKKTNED